MRKIFLLGSVLGAFTFGIFPLAGCGDGGTSGAAGDSAAPTIESACKDFAAAICGQYSRCSPFLLEVAFGDQSTCEERLMPRCLEAPDVDGSAVTAGNVAECADAYEAQSCEESFGASPVICNVPGEKADGETCATGAECKGNICDGPSSECGKCTSALAAGEACDGATDYCDAGLFCGASSKCESYAKKGEACTDTKPCDGGLSCDGGKCAAPAGIGDDCTNVSCDLNAGGFCSQKTNKCIKIGIAKLGASCGYDTAADTIALCEADTRCELAPMMATGTCTALSKGGEACSIDANGTANCISGYDCINSKCTTDYPTCK